MTNKLIFEKSSYLQQHAHNPVNWFSWCDEAFEIARKEDKPVFLSIGYSTCHWCHVMEKESFEDQEVADLLNSTFINIKVDKEERPDIDHLYMSVCQIMTGSGGWPLTILLTPDKKPFYATTYIPKEDNYGHSGIKNFIKQVKNLWSEKRDKIEESVEEIILFLKKNEDEKLDYTDPDPEIIHTAFRKIAQSFDKDNAGFGKAPKFPLPINLLFLLRYWNEFKNDYALDMVNKTLTKLRNGGIYDQIGYGFHRYSTDSIWLLPHFEKMLYDQALLTLVYTEAFQATKDNTSLEIAKEIVDYVLRDLTAKDGGFYSAEDADSEGIEGKYYTWLINDISSFLEYDELEISKKFYNLKNDGNFTDPHSKPFSNLNIFNSPLSIQEFGLTYGIEPENLKFQLERIRKKIYNERIKRIPPFKDKKILTDWNSLMIVALLKLYRVTGDNLYRMSAENGLNKILINFKNNGKLSHVIDDDRVIPAFLDDYAFLIWALLESYESGFNPEYLQYSIELNKIMLSDFFDGERNTFYFTSKSNSDLFVRKTQQFDSVTPSSCSIALNNLIKIADYINNPELITIVTKSLRASNNQISSYPAGSLSVLLAYLNLRSPKYKLVISAAKIDEKSMNFIKKLWELPFKNISIVLITDETAKDLEKINDNFKNYKRIDGKTTYYLCKDQLCLEPTQNINAIFSELN